MRGLRAVLPGALAAAAIGASATDRPAQPQLQTGCQITGPLAFAPASLHRIHLGMSVTELMRVLGPADYSPVEGQYYFHTAGICPLADSGRRAGCGVVADFRHLQQGETQLTDSLQQCSWGALGE